MIGARLSEIRKDHGDTQTNLAAKLMVTVSAVRSWEQEKSSPSHEMLVAICRLYNVSSDYLLGLSGDSPIGAPSGRSVQFDDDELIALHDYADYLLWKRSRK